jgi:hypothetical protein
MQKRKVLGKFLYGLSFLDLKEDKEEWEQFLKEGGTRRPVH